MIFTSFCFLPSSQTSTVRSGLSSPLAFKKSASASIASGRVAGAVPIGGVLAVVEQILDQPRSDVSPLGSVFAKQLQIVGIGLDLAAVPVPPQLFSGSLR